MTVPGHFKPGDRVASFELVREIAKGGMGAVWFARLERGAGFEKHFALKTILPEFSMDPRFRAMFLDEARIAAAISHANVVQIIDLGEYKDTLFMVMEWIDGESLHRMVRSFEHRRLTLPPNIVGRIMVEICAGLHAVHELKDRAGASLEVVHRDVSPQNILITEQGVPKIIDFGIAKARGRLAGDTAAGGIKGKLMYMAPEQIIGRHIDRRVDVWGVGAVLYHLLSGSPPFDGDNEAQTLQAIVSGQPPPPMPPRVPPEVQTVVMRALSFDPNVRFPTAAALAAALEGALRASGLLATVADVGIFVREYRSGVAQTKAQAKSSKPPPSLPEPTPSSSQRTMRRVTDVLAKIGPSSPASMCITCGATTDTAALLCAGCSEQWIDQGTALVVVRKAPVELTQAAQASGDAALVDAVSGERALVLLPAPRARQAVENLQKRGVEAVVVATDRAHELVPRDLYALAGVVLLAGVVAGLQVSSGFFVLSPIVALGIVVGAIGTMRKPSLTKVLPRSTLEPSAEASIAEAFSRAPPGNARSLVLSVATTARRTAGRAQASAPEMNAALSELAKASADAAIDAARLEKSLVEVASPQRAAERQRIEGRIGDHVLALCDAVDALGELGDSAFFMPDPDTAPKLRRVARQIADAVKAAADVRPPSLPPARRAG